MFSSTEKKNRFFFIKLRTWQWLEGKKEKYVKASSPIFDLGPSVASFLVPNFGYRPR